MYRYILKSSTSDCWQLWFAVSNFLFPAPSFSSAAPSTALSAEFSLSQKIIFLVEKKKEKVELIMKRFFFKNILNLHSPAPCMKARPRWVTCWAIMKRFLTAWRLIWKVFSFQASDSHWLYSCFCIWILVYLYLYCIWNQACFLPGLWFPPPTAWLLDWLPGWLTPFLGKTNFKAKTKLLKSKTVL